MRSESESESENERESESESESESERERERERGSESERDYCGRRSVLIEAVRMAMISPQSATRGAITSGASQCLRR